MRLAATLIALFTAVAGASAADPAPVGRWSLGAGQAGEAAATADAAIASGTVLRAGAESPVRVELAAPAIGCLMLAPASVARVATDGSDLVIEVSEGLAQLELADKGRWRSVLVRAGGLEGRVLKGTCLAERAGGPGWVALVKGALAVHGTSGPEAAKWRQLKPRQAVVEGAAGTPAALEDLAARPQLDAAAATRLAAREQAKVADDASWRRDQAAAALACAAMADDAATAAWLAVQLARADGTAGSEAVARCAAKAPELAVDLAVTVASCAPAAAADIAGAAAGAVPAKAGAIAGAVSAAVPDAAPDIVVAALSSAPDHGKAIVDAAIAAVPAQKDAIIGVASVIAPESVGAP